MRTPSTNQRSDILVSVCLPVLHVESGIGNKLCKIAAALDAAFRYWEMIVVVPPVLEADLFSLLAHIRNLRILGVHTDSNIYHSRLIAAAEAIGDVVAITNLRECLSFDIVAMLGKAIGGETIISGRYDRDSLFDPLLRALGRSSGFRVMSSYAFTTVYPRALLDGLLAHPLNDLAIRFAPLNARYPVESVDARNGITPVRAMRSLRRSASIIDKLLTASAGKVLSVVSAVSMVVAAGSLLYAIYAVSAWFLLSSIARGWLSISLSISMVSIFLAMTIFGLSSGLKHIITLVNPPLSVDVTSEQNVSDLYRHVFDDLNLELTSAKGEMLGPDNAARRSG